MNHFTATFCLFLIILTSFQGCSPGREGRVRILFDTDTNNEVDDQHALAYLLMNDEVFDLEGVTVNATSGGGSVEEHYAEAKRVMRLLGKLGVCPLLKGADRSYDEIREHLHDPWYDGIDAVEFIIELAKTPRNDKLVVLAVGKLTNIALALEKSPGISSNIRVLWLGSNFPDGGEYNLENDVDALNFVLSTDVEFGMALVRYGEDDGTGAVTVSRDELVSRISGAGPHLKASVTGRDGGQYSSFAEYSISLFDHSELHAPDQNRPLFDMAAVAIVKNPRWAQHQEIAAPYYDNDSWLIYPDNPRKITVWDRFDREAIVEDFFSSLTR